jgi:predicted O-linked N-acetylglucosamine transferase (SPINDLY family)
MSIAGTPESRDKWGLPENAFVFCCFNQPYKIDADLFSRWMRIMGRIEESVLWLVERGEPAKVNLFRAAENAGIDPRRIIFAGFVPIDRNLSRLRHADLVLDTLTYNGGATTSNALWAGVPVLTVLGSHWVSRMSASALHAVGLPELVAADRDQYEQTAMELAGDPKRLQRLRMRLGRQRSTAPLFDTAGFTRHVEQAYLHMWARYAVGLPPASFRVSP